MGIVSTQLLGIVNAIKPVKLWILDTFFGRTELCDTLEPSVDILAQDHRASVDVDKRAGHTIIDDQGFKRATFELSVIKQAYALDIIDSLNVMPGEPANGFRSPAQRMEDRKVQLFARMLDMIRRRIQAMACEALITGKILLKGEGVERTVSFGMRPEHQVSPTVKWNQYATSTPITDLMTWASVFSNAGQNIVTDVVMNSNTRRHMMLSAEVKGNALQKSVFDMQSVNSGVLTTEPLAPGLAYCGKINLLPADLWIYDAKYNDHRQNGDLVKYIPDGVVLLLSRTADFRVVYGPILHEKALYSMPVFPHEWAEPSGDAVYVGTMSSPLACPFDIDSVVSAQVL